MARAHGVRGQVVVELVSNVAARMVPGSVLHGPGGRVLRVEASTPTAASGGRPRWIVSFAGVTGRDQAEALHGAVLSADPLPDDGETLWVHDLIGCRVVDAEGVARGTVTAVEANPASDLLVLDCGALVPLRFVTAHSAGTVVVDVPPGLWEL